MEISNTIAWVVVVSLLLTVSCHKDQLNRPKDNFAGTYPACLQIEIDEMLSKPPFTPRATLTKYLYNNTYIYYMRPQSYPPIVVDENCATICMEAFLGSTCSDDWNDDVVEVVWKDPR